MVGYRRPERGRRHRDARELNDRPTADQTADGSDGTLRTLPPMAPQDADTPGESQRGLRAFTRAVDRVGTWWLLAGVLTLAALYHWLQSLRRVTPWIFGDEVRYTEFARAAARGVFTVAGERRRVGALQGFLLAPAWFADDAGTAWSLAKLINVVAFCLTAVPVYLLARRFVSSRAAVLAALASVVLPISFYASTMMQEPLALPVTLTAVLVTVQLMERFTWTRVALLVLVCLVGAGIRGQLTIVPLAAASALLLDALASAIRRRPIAVSTTLTGLAFVGFGVLAFREGYGLDLVQSGWRIATDRPGDTLDTVLHSIGAVIVGVAVIPAIALIATMGRLGVADRSQAAFGATAAGFNGIFILYTGLKSASLDFIPVSLVEERNLIYLEPLAIVAVAALASAVRWRGLIVPTLVTVALLVVLPITGVGSNLILSENPGLSWVWHIGRKPDAGLETPLTLALVALALVGALALRRRLLVPVLTATAVLAFLSGTIAYRGDHELSRAFAATWLQPDREWVDQATGGKTTVMVIPGNISDPNGVFSLLFWNESIESQVLIPGLPALSTGGTPVAPNADGTFAAGSAEYALHTEAFRPDGTTVPSPTGARYLLTRLSTPTRLGTAVIGVEPDRWVRDSLVIQRFDAGPAGALSLEVSTLNHLSGRPRVVTATVGSKTTTWTIPPDTTRTLRLPVPAGPFTATFALSPTDPAGPYDPRLLSLQINAVIFPGGARR